MQFIRTLLMFIRSFGAIGWGGWAACSWASGRWGNLRYSAQRHLREACEWYEEQAWLETESGADPLP